jgi:hypothetical protein
MGRLFHKEIKQVEFCDRCGSVCDSACRADAAHEEARQALLSGWRLV